jgi:3-phenylpropionate/cinnamic acid dioxygenase small subunit
MLTDEAQDPALSTRTRIRSNESAYAEIFDFLVDEATLLDEDRHHEWLDRTTDDVIYRMPVRQNLFSKDGRGTDSGSTHCDDNRMTLELRVRHNVDAPSASDREPPPRIRRFISNVAVYHGDADDEYVVHSYIALFRNRFRMPTYDTLTAKREDVIRRTPEGLKLASRLIVVDQAMLGSSYLNTFL